MTIEFNGAVILGNQKIPGVVAIGDQTLALKIGTKTIDEWPRSAVSFEPNGGGVWTLAVPKESFDFDPIDASGFAAVLEPESMPEPAPQPHIVEGPPPQFVTTVAFYLLVAVTLTLGLWAVLSLFS